MARAQFRLFLLLLIAVARVCLCAASDFLLLDTMRRPSSRPTLVLPLSFSGSVQFLDQESHHGTIINIFYKYE
jgi:hypothetical protein